MDTVCRCCTIMLSTIIVTGFAKRDLLTDFSKLSLAAIQVPLG